MRLFHGGSFAASEQRTMTTQTSPVAFNHPIATNAPVAAQRAIRIRASAATVWAVLTDIDRWPTWHMDIQRASAPGVIQVGTEFSWKTGGASIRSTLHTVVRDRAFGWTGRTFGMRAIHNWSLTSDGSTTEVVVAESLEGFFAKLLRRSFQHSLEAGMQRWLEALKNACERGRS